MATVYVELLRVYIGSWATSDLSGVIFQACKTQKTDLSDAPNQSVIRHPALYPQDENATSVEHPSALIPALAYSLCSCWSLGCSGGYGNYHLRGIIFTV